MQGHRHQHGAAQILGHSRGDTDERNDIFQHMERPVVLQGMHERAPGSLEQHAGAALPEHGFERRAVWTQPRPLHFPVERIPAGLAAWRLREGNQRLAPGAEVPQAAAFHQRPAMHAHRRKHEVAGRAPKRAQRFQGAHVWTGAIGPSVERRAPSGLPETAAPAGGPIPQRRSGMLAPDTRRSTFDFIGRCQ